MNILEFTLTGFPVRVSDALLFYSKRHNKFLLPVPAKAIYGSFCRTENEIFNVVNYNKSYDIRKLLYRRSDKFTRDSKEQRL